MKKLFVRFIRHIYIIVGIMFLIVLTACSAPDEVSESDIQETPTEESITEKLQTTVLEPPSFDDYEDYINYISDIPAFEPYYQTAFDFEELPGGISSVPIEEVKVMYEEMNTKFDYILVSEFPLVYRGNYEGDTSFVDGFEQYQTTGVGMDIPNPVNVVSNDWDGNEILTTPLKTILLGESIFNRFDGSIEEGRNLQISDFILGASDEPINVVLGPAYMDIYELGDIFSLELISEMMDFQVVGFYKSGVDFSMEVGALHHVNFDHAIVMPYFIPDYEPVGEAAVFQHAFHIAELTSGYINISELVEKINDETYDQTVDILKEMAERNDLSGLFKIGYWPVGFVW